MEIIDKLEQVLEELDLDYGWGPSFEVNLENIEDFKKEFNEFYTKNKNSFFINESEDISKKVNEL